MFELSTAARAIGAELRGSDAAITGVSTDSRRVRAGDLFVALKGPRFDGHEFVDQALAAGAAGALVSDTACVRFADPAMLLTADTRLALGKLASWWRSRFEIPLVAVTGSNGKTTVKEMLASVLRAHAGSEAVLATTGNLNNDIGVPLTLLRLAPEHRFAVIETGMNHLGEISYLSRMARPTVALITNAGTAHLGEVGSVEGIARAKGEIFEGMDAQGVAVINSDDAFADYWRGLAKGRRIVDFGLDKRAWVSARFELSDGGSLVTVRPPGAEFVVLLQVPGVHNVKNALAAATIAVLLGIAPQTISLGLNAYSGTSGRMQRIALDNGATLIDDTYNANPESMRAALSVLGACHGRKLFVIGDMGELGDASAEMHAEVGAFARRSGVDRLFALGSASRAAVQAFGNGASNHESLEEMIAALKREITADATVLVKGSRFMRMERVIAALGAVIEGAQRDH